jgi:fibronectin-binding autotransporter adhesin
MFRNWRFPLAKIFSRKACRASGRRRVNHRPLVDELEARMVPATFEWTGHGSTNAWNLAANWINTDTQLPQAPNPTGFQDQLLFPSSIEEPTLDPTSKAGQTIGFDSGFLSPPPQFAGIIYDDSGYSVSGGAVFALGSGGIAMNATSGSNTIAAGINVSGISTTINVAAGGQLNLNGTIAGSTDVTKQGGGTLALSGNNNFSGSLTIAAGTVQAKNNNALGTPTSGAATATRVNGGAALQLVNVSVPATESLTLNGTLLSDESDTSAWAGPVHVTASATMQKNLGGLLTSSGAIDGSGNLLIAGNGGIVDFQGNNSAYQGRITVAGDSLNVNNANALGSTTTSSGTPADTTVQAGGRLLLDTRAGSFTLAEPLILSGAGPSPAARDALSLDDPGGTTGIISGNIQLAGDTTITGAGLTLSGAISTAASVPASATTNLTILDAPFANNGTLTLSGAGANTYRGTTTSEIGTLNLNKLRFVSGTFQGVTAIPGDLLATDGSHVVLVGGNADHEIAANADVTIDGGLLNLNGNNNTIRTLTLMNGGDVSTGTGILTITGDVTVDAASGASSISGNLNLIGVRTFAVNGTTNAFTVSAVVSGSSSSGITKTGTGTMVLSADNSNYAGTTVVTQGTLKISNANALGSPGVINSSFTATVGGTTVQTGAALALAGTFSRFGISDISVNEAVLLDGGTVLGESDGARHTLTSVLGINNSGTVSQGTSGITAIQSFSPSGTNPVFIKDGNGTVQLNGHTGDVIGTAAINVLRGTFELTAAASIGSGDTLTIGQDPVNNVVIPAKLLLDSDGQTDSSVPVAIKNGGTLDLNNHFDAISALTMDGGAAVTTGTGTLEVSGGGITVQNTSVPASISGNLQIAGSSPSLTITTADGSAVNDLVVSAAIAGPAGTPLIKAGPGNLLLSGSSSYAGQTQIDAGSVTVIDAAGLGASIAGTTVAAGASVSIATTNTVFEPLTLNGAGVNGQGALLDPQAAPVTLSGPITLASDATVNVVTNGILTIDAPVGGPGGLTKIGNGTLILAEALIEGVPQPSTYTGATMVNGGTLVVHTLASPTVTVNGGAALAGTGPVNDVSVLGGTLRPGDVSGSPSPGIFTVNGSVTFDAAASLVVDLNGSDPGSSYDQLNVNGAVSINNAALVLHPATTPFGALLDIVHASGGVSGNFTDPLTGAVLESGDTFNAPDGELFQMFSDADDVFVAHQDTKAAFSNRSVTPSISEGGVATLTGTIVEPDPQDSFTLVVNWGDGSALQTLTFPPGSNGRQVSVSHTYATPGVYTVHASWHDPEGAGNSADLQVVVNNVPPAVDAGPDVHLRRGGVLNQNGSFTDPGTGTWMATVDYGDGHGPQELKLGRDKQFHLHHKYRGRGTYRVTVTVADDHGGVGTASFLVVVD